VRLTINVNDLTQRARWFIANANDVAAVVNDVAVGIRELGIARMEFREIGEQLERCVAAVEESCGEMRAEANLLAWRTSRMVPTMATTDGWDLGADTDTTDDAPDELEIEPAWANLGLDRGELMAITDGIGGNGSAPIDPLAPSDDHGTMVVRVQHRKQGQPLNRVTFHFNPLATSTPLFFAQEEPGATAITRNELWSMINQLIPTTATPAIGPAVELRAGVFADAMQLADDPDTAAERIVGDAGAAAAQLAQSIASIDTFVGLCLVRADGARVTTQLSTWFSTSLGELWSVELPLDPFDRNSGLIADDSMLIEPISRDDLAASVRFMVF
jgi:hypothetical protein